MVKRVILLVLILSIMTGCGARSSELEGYGEGSIKLSYSYSDHVLVDINTEIAHVDLQEFQVQIQPYQWSEKDAADMLSKLQIDTGETVRKLTF